MYSAAYTIIHECQQEDMRRNANRERCEISAHVRVDKNGKAIPVCTNSCAYLDNETNPSMCKIFMKNITDITRNVGCSCYFPKRRDKPTPASPTKLVKVVRKQVI